MGMLWYILKLVNLAQEIKPAENQHAYCLFAFSVLGQIRSENKNNGLSNPEDGNPGIRQRGSVTIKDTLHADRAAHVLHTLAVANMTTNLCPPGVQQVLRDCGGATKQKQWNPRELSAEQP